MNVAMIASDSKKELMIDFCIAYRGILAKHSLVATGTTGKVVERETGLKIKRVLSGKTGGDQQLAARISCNEIDLLLYFRDPLVQTPPSLAEWNMLRLCDMHNIPVATNIATAEVLVLGLERGDFDWRNIVNPSL